MSGALSKGVAHTGGQYGSVQRMLLFGFVARGPELRVDHPSA